MRGARAWLAALLLAGAFTWGILRLFSVQFSVGDVYPEYSSLRSDPLGSRLLFDSLARLPGLRLTRNYLPLDYFSAEAATVLLLALRPASLQDPESQFLRRIEALAGRGNRVVVALAREFGDSEANSAPLQSTWQVKAARSPRPYFAEASGWNVIERAGGKPVVIERAFGQGTVVLFADSDAFANASMVELQRLQPISTALGSNKSIVFDEAHLGITESGSVVGLARRYRLLGLALGLALCAALALWRNASAFPPREPPAETERLAGRTSFTGLVTLLRRHLRPEQLPSVCWQEWLKTNNRATTPARAQRAAGLATGAPRAPLATLREIQSVLRAKGDL